MKLYSSSYNPGDDPQKPKILFLGLSFIFLSIAILFVFLLANIKNTKSSAN